jgi:hypothetical protein
MMPWRRNFARRSPARGGDRGLPSEAEAEDLVARIDLRAQLARRLATSAAAVDTPSYRIQQHTRHKSAEMIARYIREAEKWTNNGF